MAGAITDGADKKTRRLAGLLEGDAG